MRYDVSSYHNIYTLNNYVIYHILRIIVKKTNDRANILSSVQLSRSYMPLTITIPSKCCKKCNTIKPLDQFGVYNRAKDGKRSACKACTNYYNNQIKQHQKVTNRSVIQKELNNIYEDMRSAKDEDTAEHYIELAHRSIELCRDRSIEKKSNISNSLEFTDKTLFGQDIPDSVSNHDRSFRLCSTMSELFQSHDDYMSDITIINTLRKLGNDDIYLYYFNTITITKDQRESIIDSINSNNEQ